MEKADFDRCCPSFYAKAAKSDVSSKYGFINSRDVAINLAHKGWLPTSAQESRSVDKSNVGFQKHLVRFSHRDMMIGDRQIELGMINSHNRTSSFRIFGGVLEFACANGLIILDEDFGEIRITHLGSTAQVVDYAIESIRQGAEKIVAKIKDWESIFLTKDDQELFAMKSLVLAYPDKHIPIKPDQLLLPRRAIDKNPSSWSLPQPTLWKTFNVVQENLIKGGLEGHASTNRRLVTRPVKNIDRDISLNQALWGLASLTAKAA